MAACNESMVASSTSMAAVSGQAGRPRNVAQEPAIPAAPSARKRRRDSLVFMRGILRADGRQAVRGRDEAALECSSASYPFTVW